MVSWVCPYTVVHQIADENGFLFVTENIPLPVDVIPYQDITVKIWGMVVKDGYMQVATTTGVENKAYSLSSNKTENKCDQTQNIWGVYDILPKDKNRKNETFKVSFPATIFNPKQLVDGKIVQKIDKTVRTYIVKDGSLQTHLIKLKTCHLIY